jgi:Carboxypeptidase regulatory-like domain
MRNIRVHRSFATFLIAAGVSCLTAQTLDTGILGTITDPTGAVVAGATVNITQTATSVRRTTQTAADGKYEVRYLVPGEYSIEVRVQGFRAARASSVVVQINQQARLDFSLQVGEVQETVEVTVAAPLLNTETATLGEVVARERIVNLPLNGRTFTQLAALYSWCARQQSQSVFDLDRRLAHCRERS